MKNLLTVLLTVVFIGIFIYLALFAGEEPAFENPLKNPFENFMSTEADCTPSESKLQKCICINGKVLSCTSKEHEGLK